VSRIVLITGAGGNIGTKLRAHFSGFSWALRLPYVATHAMTPRPIWLGRCVGVAVCRATRQPRWTREGGGGANAVPGTGGALLPDHSPQAHRTPWLYRALSDTFRAPILFGRFG
jgi:hypothetical protein